MGCFLGCFGISTKRKRRKPANRILPGDSKLVSYEPLDSSVSINLDIPEEPISSSSQLSNKPKERSSIKIRKKVSFNLNVQTYEPIPAEETTTYQFLQSVEEKESENNGAEAGKGSLPSLSEGDSNSLQMGSYPTNYRYQNCRESYDEDDEMAFEECDLEDDDYFYDYDDEDDSDDGDKDVDDQKQRREESLDQFDSLNMESAKGASLVHLDEDKAKNQMPLSASTDGELKSFGCGNARIRSQYLCSVLNPVENTTKWKEIKARAAPAPKNRRKENIALEEEPQIPFSSKLRSDCSPNYNQSKPLLQDIAVDASLSNWLILTNTDGSKTTGSSKSCSIAFDTPSLKNSICDGSFSWRSREDRVILDITNLEAL
ncbi:uncharacterized protein LOC111306743 [Durio zibethinus]|uniref:Uncharacterized protein LOC111306743 n=1 Tax=Durio zibethinus TaxID=66656 RepID=A0A6P6A5T0_DURZI|nr:uncharacterized protein LOC111306743 [Durio zibethinus]